MNNRHFSLIDAIEFIKFVLVLSETVLVLVSIGAVIRVPIRIPLVAEYE